MILAIKNYYRNYFNFGGTAPRKDVVFIILYQIILAAILFWIIDQNIITLEVAEYIYYAHAIFNVFPTLTLFARRFRGAGRSPANVIWLFVPILGWIIILSLLFSVSEEQRIDSKW